MDIDWDRFRSEFPSDICPAEVGQILAGFQGDRSGRGLCLAFSGGPDSLFLLVWFRVHFSALARKSLVLHFNHGTRPKENAAEAVYAEKVATELGYRFVCGQGPGGRKFSESDLRAARFEFFRKEMSAGGIDTILLGHQADDVAETFLARIARGSGPEGLGAPRPVTYHNGPWPHARVRPLLHLPGTSIRQGLEDLGLQAVSDPSNRSGVYLRNRIRAHVVPAWRDAVDRDLYAGVSRARRLQEEVSDFLESTVSSLMPDGIGVTQIPLSRLQEVPRAPRRFLLERWLLAHSKNPGPDVVDRVLDAIEEEELGRWSVAKNSWIELGSDFLSMVVGTTEGMEPNWAPIRWGGSTQLYLPDRSVLCRRVLPGERNLFSAIKAGEVDVKTAAFLRIPGDASEVLEVRRWQPGDKFQPLGAPGRKKLQDCFTDRKISPEQRRTLPVICWRGKICWVPGLPPAEEFRVTSAEESLLSLTYLQS